MQMLLIMYRVGITLKRNASNVRLMHIFYIYNGQILLMTD